MKLFYKICVVILVIGIGLCVAGAAAGGDLYTSYYNGRLHGLREARSYLDDIGDYIDDIGTLPRRRVEETDNYYAGIGMTDSERGGGRSGSSSDSGTSGASTADTASGLPSLDGVTSFSELDFELGTGNFLITEGSECGISGGDSSWIKSNIENGVWHIETTAATLSHGWYGHGGDGSDHDVVITVPHELTVSKMDLEIGAANVSIDAAISAAQIDIELGAGSLEFYNCGVSKSLDAEVGMGYLLLDLPEAWEAYQLDADVSAGSLTLNGKPLITGLSGEMHTGTGTRKLDFDLDMGSIEIVTAD